MPVSRIAVGAPGELSHPDTAKAAVSEFISMLIFIFAGSGSGMAFSKLTASGHVNPAVTFGAFVGGNITLFQTVVYWVAQLLGFVVACLFLKIATGGAAVGALSLSPDVGTWNAIVFEIVMTFGLVYTVIRS